MTENLVKFVVVTAAAAAIMAVMYAGIQGIVDQGVAELFN